MQQLAGQYQPIDEMSKEELKQELATFRALWTWIPDSAKFYLTKIGSMVGVQVRNYHRYVGLLGVVHFKVEAFEVEVFEKTYNHNTGRYMEESKLIVVPVSNVIQFEDIHEQIEVPETEESAIGELPPLYDQKDKEESLEHTETS